MPVTLLVGERSEGVHAPDLLGKHITDAVVR
jgi:hypothetical protein